jgi:hypothetical protein
LGQWKIGSPCGTLSSVEKGRLASVAGDRRWRDMERMSTIVKGT